MSFTSRVYLSLVVLAAALILLAHGLFESDLQSAAQEASKAQGRQQLALIERTLQHETRPFSQASLQERLLALGQTLDRRLTFIADSGRVLADSGRSQTSLEGLDSQSNQPEIRQAAREGFGTSLRAAQGSRGQALYLAKRLEVPGLGPGYLRLAQPRSEMTGWLPGPGRRIGVLLLSALPLSSLLGWLLTSRLRKEVSHLSTAAESIGSHGRSTRIDFLPLREFVPFVRSINRLSKKTQTDYRTIEEQRDELEAILNGMQEGVLVLDNRGRIAKANRAIERIFQAPFEAVGRKPIEIIRCPELQSAVEDILDSGDSESRRLTASLPEQRFFDVTIIPVNLTSAKGPEMIVVLHDVSELKRLEQVRKDFVANISHELRTPLTSIKGYAETLLSSPQPDADTLASFMKVIQKNVNTMTHLLENLLQLARLESEQPRTPLETMDARTAFSAAWEVCAPLAADKAITLQNELPEGSIAVAARYEQLVRVWINLLDNAVKYSPEQGTIRISARKEAGQWVFSIQDDGPGIPQRDQNRVFERFYRVETERDGRKVHGTGLGLAICKHILQHHRGAIWVVSPVPETLQGSLFSFSLPQA